MEKEWLDTLAAVDPGHVTYTDYVECGRLRKYFHLVLESLIQISFLFYFLCSSSCSEFEGNSRLQDCYCFNSYAYP